MCSDNPLAYPSPKPFPTTPRDRRGTTAASCRGGIQPRVPTPSPTPSPTTPAAAAAAATAALSNATASRDQHFSGQLALKVRLTASSKRDGNDWA